MEKLNAIWAWADGKKTAFGFLFMCGSDIAEILECPPKVVKVLAYIGMALGVGGMIHKGVKAKAGE